MKIIVKKLLLLLILASLITPNNLRAEDKYYLTILASPSLAAPLAKIGREFAKENNIIISFVFDYGEEKFLKIIQDGEAADVIISENPFIFQELKRQGLINVLSETIVAKNNIVIAKNRDDTKNYINISDIFKNINKNNKLLIGANEESYLGNLVIKMLGLNEIKKLNKNISSFVEVYDTNESITQIINRDVIGIFYQTDIYNEKTIEILAKLDDKLFGNKLSTDITYRSALIAGGEQKLGEKFQKELKSEGSKKIFRKFGFN